MTRKAPSMASMPSIRRASQMMMVGRRYTMEERALPHSRRRSGGTRMRRRMNTVMLVMTVPTMIVLVQGDTHKQEGVSDNAVGDALGCCLLAVPDNAMDSLD